MKSCSISEVWAAFLLGKERMPKVGANGKITVVILILKLINHILYFSF